MPDPNGQQTGLLVWQIAPKALSCFDALQSVEPEAMIGRWRGAGLPTGHPLDGVLELLGWMERRS